MGAGGWAELLEHGGERWAQLGSCAGTGRCHPLMVAVGPLRAARCLQLQAWPGPSVLYQHSSSCCPPSTSSVLLFPAPLPQGKELFGGRVDDLAQGGLRVNNEPILSGCCLWAGVGMKSWQ